LAAFLRVLPNRSQFFQYDSITLSCEQQRNSSEWSIKRNTSRNTNEECPTSWGRRNESNCYLSDLYLSDSAVYWCESGAGGCSNTIGITVTAGSVILEYPVLPVMEGEAVILRCINGITSSFNLTTNFYKDGLLIGSSSTGDFTIPSVSKSDEGPYMCNVSGAGQSPDSWLSVTGAGRPESYMTALTLILLPVVVKGFSLLFVNLLMLLCFWRNHKGRPDLM
ncbi:low affinity immunoglobulin gamma Fc region receptor II-like, partial [Channa argus]|uniref:low affinity immunoglobulin gamma Fc region receptor II-like n=1 Tax=Channa argus TaxID=215402 RepID=UPI003520C3E8